MTRKFPFMNLLFIFFLFLFLNPLVKAVVPGEPVAIEPRGIVGELDANGEDTPILPGLYNVRFFSYANQDKACIVYKNIKGGISYFYSAICSENGNPPYYATLQEAQSLPLVHQGNLAKTNIYNCYHYDDPEAFFFNDPTQNEAHWISVYVNYTYQQVCFKPEGLTTSQCVNLDLNLPSEDIEFTLEHVEEIPEFFLDKEVLVEGTDSELNLGCMDLDDIPTFFLTLETWNQILAHAIPPDLSNPPPGNDAYASNQTFVNTILIGSRRDLLKTNPYGGFWKAVGRVFKRLLGIGGNAADEAAEISEMATAAKRRVGKAATGEAGHASEDMIPNPAYEAQNVTNQRLIHDQNARTSGQADASGSNSFFDLHGVHHFNPGNGWIPSKIPNPAVQIPYSMPSLPDIANLPAVHNFYTPHHGIPNYN